MSYRFSNVESFVGWVHRENSFMKFQSLDKTSFQVDYFQGVLFRGSSSSSSSEVEMNMKLDEVELETCFNQKKCLWFSDVASVCVRETKEVTKSESKQNLGENWVSLFFSCSLFHSCKGSKERVRQQHISHSLMMRATRTRSRTHLMSWQGSCHVLFRSSKDLNQTDVNKSLAHVRPFMFLLLFQVFLSHFSLKTQVHAFNCKRKWTKTTLFFSRFMHSFYCFQDLASVSQLYLQSIHFAHNYTFGCTI